MRILVSNDDGFDAPGLQALVAALQPCGELMIVAPVSEQSAVGHAITIHDPLKVQERRRDGVLLGYAVHGTPADCVKLALCSLLPQAPDVLISGINQGANLGTDIIYSGTVSAATEGTLLGIPSLAVSIDSYEPDAYFTSAGLAARALLEVLPALQVPSGTLLNMNVPNLPWEQIRGWRVTVQGKTKYMENYVERIDPRGNRYYWIAGTLVEQEECAHADYRTVKQGYISVTPLHFDVTNHACVGALRAALEPQLNRT